MEALSKHCQCLVACNISGTKRAQRAATYKFIQPASLCKCILLAYACAYACTGACLLEQVDLQIIAVDEYFDSNILHSIFDSLVHLHTRRRMYGNADHVCQAVAHCIN